MNSLYKFCHQCGNLKNKTLFRHERHHFLNSPIVIEKLYCRPAQFFLFDMNWGPIIIIIILLLRRLLLTCFGCFVLFFLCGGAILIVRCSQGSPGQGENQTRFFWQVGNADFIQI